MPAKKYIVELDSGERELLTGFISTGKTSAKAILKARILLKADEAEGGPSWLDSQIVEALDTNLTMVMRTREKFVTEGLDAVLARRLVSVASAWIWPTCWTENATSRHSISRFRGST